MTVQITMAQLDLVVGDIEGNTHRIIDAAKDARQRFGADIVVFPELTITGYPPEDLLLRPSLHDRIDQACAQLANAVPDITLIVGYPAWREGYLYNAAGVLSKGQWIAEYYKQVLPNYQVFDEKRYFEAGQHPLVLDLHGMRWGILVCEDVWVNGPAEQARNAGAEALLVLNASPYHQNKMPVRRAITRDRAAHLGLPILYCNCVGGQDELVFDGGSYAIADDGQVLVQGPVLKEALVAADLSRYEGRVVLLPGAQAPIPEPLSYLYQALVLGLRDYVNKSGFKGVVMGLSGGIDSGLSLAIAVDALGADRVHAVMMPYHYTSSMSVEDAEAQAKLLGVDYEVLPIAPMVEAFMSTLSETFAGTERDTTEENLQARCRGVMLMAISNKKGLMVQTTGNKSEIAVGYATLYGDMVGGFNALKDVYKTMVFELARYRNQISPAIPERVITRPPSAELAPDQKDEDSLPAYPVLDAILERYIEGDQSAEAIIQSGFRADDVYQVIRLVDRNEYKRRQAAPGVRASVRGFGRDRRYPIVNYWQPGH